jgi:hypothetical protein
MTMPGDTSRDRRPEALAKGHAELDPAVIFAITINDPAVSNRAFSTPC